MKYFLSTRNSLYPYKKYFDTENEAYEKLFKIIEHTLADTEKKLEEIIKIEEEDPLNSYQEVKKKKLKAVLGTIHNVDSLCSNFTLIEINEKICKNYRDIFIEH